MNILIDLVPKSVEIDGIEYKINSDFRTSILFELLMQDTELDEETKLIQSIQLYYHEIPDDLEKSIEKILWFYRCGNDEVSANKKTNGKSVKNVYDFNYDADYIFSAFLDQYNIDLQDIEYLHWWKFKAMFKALKEDNQIVKIMGYRSMDLSKIKDKEERAHYKKMQDLYKIQNRMSKDDKEKLEAIQNALLNGGEISHLL